MSVASVAALLNNVPTAWAVPLAALIGAVNYDLSELCTVDPVAVPSFTADDVVSLINGPLIDIQTYTAALAKFHQLVKAYAWFQFCQCSPGATPAAPTPPAQPAGMPSIDPITQPGTPCIRIPFDDTFPGGTTHVYPTVNINGLGISSFYLTANAVVPNIQDNANFDVKWFDINGTQLLSCGTNIDFNTQGTPIVQQCTVPVNAASVRFTNTAQGTIGSIRFFGKWEAYCGGTTPAGPPTQGCCPPDPQLMAQVKSILDYVTLLQRQIAPFAYVTGPVHAGLSGAGQLSISSAIVGLRIQATTIPARIGLAAGDPSKYFGLGEVALGDADGWFYTRSVDRTTIVWTPKDAQLATSIGYTIPEDVVVTISELVREP